MAVTDCETPSYPTPRWLMDAIEAMVYRSAPLYAPQIAESMGISESLLYHWATRPDNLSGKHSRMHLDRLVPLTLASHNFLLLDAIEARVGRVAQPLLLDHPPHPVAQAGQTGEAMGHALVALAQALGDGNITAEEGQQMQPLLKTLREKISELELALTIAEATEG